MTVERVVRGALGARGAREEAEDALEDSVDGAREVSMTLRWTVSFFRRASAYRPSCAATYPSPVVRWKERVAAGVAALRDADVLPPHALLGAAERGDVALSGCGYHGTEN